ncbi:MAG: phosphoribosyl-ATP diphosphatase [Planctomycetota bacterium]|nr:phosphoribosyl-ATP diphosphatase [Planctomycetota bacterium]
MDETPRPQEVLQRLMEVIEDRRDHSPEKSYTTRLFSGGVPAIARKITEEAAEVIEAAEEEGTEGRDHLIYEAADLVYHLMVMLGYKRIHWNEVESELGRRFGISGIDEKASRQTASQPDPEH